MKRLHAKSPTGADVRGFTLIEVVVSMAIMAMSLAAIYECLAVASRNFNTAQRKTMYLLEAQSLLAGIRSEGGIRHGKRSGVLPDGARWTVSIRPLPDRQPSETLKIHEVTIAISPEKGAGLELKSLQWEFAS